MAGSGSQTSKRQSASSQRKNTGKANSASKKREISFEMLAKIQAVIRGYLARKEYKKRLVKKLIKENQEMYDAEKKMIDQEMKARTTESDEGGQNYYLSYPILGIDSTVTDELKRS